MKGKRKYFIAVLFLLVGFILAAGTILICRDKPELLFTALSGVAVFMGGMFPGVAALMYGYTQEYKFDPIPKKPPDPIQTPKSPV